MLSLPPEDRALSPRTGWTRAHWEATADGLLAAMEPYRSADGAQILLPGRHSSSGCDGLEGFARGFLLAAFRTAGGGPPGLLDPYTRGLAAGPGLWPPIRDRFQPMVEAACIAIGLRLTREHVWDALAADAQERLAAYLADALTHEPVDNNWWLFPAMVGDFLASVGIESDSGRAAVERGLDRLESWYVGDGWYVDGETRAIDHYNSWAMHLYPAMLHILGTVGPGAYKERLHAFLGGYALTFDADGGMLHHGRSVTYRFASTTALFAGALTGATPLTPGQTRAMASGVLRNFLERGALSPQGLLTLGWYGPHEPSVQSYSGSASPYWAAYAFLGLLLPEQHPVWTAVEEPGPTGVRALAGPGTVVRHEGGVGQLFNHGTQHHVGDVLYDRYAYSTRTGPTSAAEVADNHFGLVAPGRIVSPRGLICTRGAGTIGDVSWAASVSGGSHDSPLVESLTVVRGSWELRIHRFTPGARVRQTGWALPGAEAEVTGGVRVNLRAEHGLSSSLLGLHGFQTAQAAEAEHGTAFGAPAHVPLVEGVSTTGWAVSAVRLHRARLSVPLPDDEPPSLDLSQGVTLLWRDGLRQAFNAAGPMTVCGP